MKTCLKVLFLGSIFAIAAICWAGQRAPEYLRVSIFIEKGADNFIPQPADFVFRSQGQILSIEAVDAVPNDAPVFLIINADSLDLSDAKLIKDDLLVTTTEYKKRGIPYSISLLSSQLANALSVADPSALQTTLAGLLSNQPASDKKTELDQQVKSLDQLAEVMKQAISANKYLRVVVAGKDIQHATQQNSEITGQLFNTLIARIVNQGVSFFFVNYGTTSGFLSQLAEEAGTVPVAATRAANGYTVFLNETLKNYILSIKPDNRSFSYKPEPFKLEIKNAAFVAERLKAPKSYWRLPLALRLPTSTGLREAAALRQQLSAVSLAEPPTPTLLVTAQRLLELSPFTLADRLFLSRLYKAAGQLDQCQNLLEQSQLLFADVWEIPYERGILYEQQGNYPQAIGSFEATLALKPNDAELPLRLARLNMKAGRQEEAFTLYDKIIASNPNHSAIRLEFATVLWTAGQLERAEQEAARALELDSTALPAYDLLGQIYLKKRQYAESAKIALAALNLDKENLIGQSIAGLSLAHLGKYREAISYLDKAIARSPRNAELYVALYQSFYGVGEFEKAYEALKAAIILDEKQPSLYLSLAQLHQKRGDLLGIGKALEAGLLKNPANFELHYALAKWFARRGDYERALVSYKAAISGAPAELKKPTYAQIGLLELLQGRSLPEAIASLEAAGFPLAKDVTEKLNERNQVAKRQSAQSQALKKLVLPGGLQPLLRFAPFLQSHPVDDRFLATVFDYLLEAEPLTPNQKEFPRQRLLLFYEQYFRFKDWLQKERLLAPQVVLKFSKNNEDIKQANKVLSYFDVKVKFKKEKAGNDILLVESKDKPAEEVTLLLSLLGLNPNLIKENSSFTIDLRDQEVPVILGFEYWVNEIFDKKSSTPDRNLLAWLDQPEAIRLYSAFSRLPDVATNWLKQRVPAKELRENLTSGLSALGGMLKFNKDGSLQIPGGQPAEKLWASLVGASPVNNEQEFLKKLFAKDDGRAIYFFASLSQGSPEVVNYFLASPQRFKKFYGQISDFSDNFMKRSQIRSFYDFADLVSLLEADKDGINFPGAEKMWTVVAKGNSSKGNLSQVDKLMRRRVRIANDEEIVSGLLKTSDDRQTIAGARKYAVLTHLLEIRPDLVDERTGLALEISYDRFGGQFGLIDDLDMNAEVLLKLLQRVEQIETSTPDEHRRITILLFQGGLGVLQILARNHAMDVQHVRLLSREFLDLDLPLNSPGAQAARISHFFMHKVLPILRTRFPQTKEEEIFIQALAGAESPFTFVWQEQTYQGNFAEYESQRISTFLERQNLPTLEPLLKSFSLLERVRKEKNNASFDDLSRMCQSLSEPQLENKHSDEYRKAILWTDLKQLKEEMQKLGRALARKKVPQIDEQILKVSAELAPFLGESMLGLIYAADVSGDDLVSQTDENFARKHDFVVKLKTAGQLISPWQQPDVIRSETLGARIQGSLVGISAALAKSKGQQVEGGSQTRFSDSTFPAMQNIAASLIHPAELSDEVLEYAAQCMSLGEALLAAAVVDDSIKARVEEFIARHIGSRRSSLISQALETGDIRKVKESMLPSELFHLGRTFHKTRSNGQQYPWHFDQLDRLNELAEKVSEKGLAQLGFPAASWYGINTLTLESPSSIDAMDNYMMSDRLAERSCELKLQLARLFFQAGVPAVLFKAVAQKMAAEVMKEVGQASVRDWTPITSGIKAMNEEAIVRIVVEIINRWQN